DGADQARKANAAKIHAKRLRRGGETAIVSGIVAPQMFTVELVAAVHGGRLVVFVLFHRRNAILGGEIRHSIYGNRTRKDEFDAVAEPSRLLDGEMQQVERAFDVDTVGGFRCEL